MSSVTAAVAPEDFKSQHILPSQVIGTIAFVFTEVMFFIALISAFLVIKASNPTWALPVGIRLPVAATAVNSFILLLSGYLLFVAGRSLKEKRLKDVEAALLRSMFLALFFVCFQGYEWFKLISFGLTMKNSIFGACFFLLVGSHALHAFSGVLLLFWLYLRSRSSIPLSQATVHASQIFWFFIVGVWPVLYLLLYFDWTA